MRRVWLVGCLVAAGCGRLGFESRARDDAGGVVDGPSGDVVVGPPMLVQIQAPGYASAPTASATIDQTTGNLLVAAVYWDQTPNTVTLSDTAGLAWTPAPKYEIPSVCGGPTGNATGAQLYYAQVTTTMTNVVTVAQTSGAQPLGVMVAEYAGLALTNVVEAESGQIAPAASNAMSVPAFTTSVPTIIVAFFNDTIGNGTIAVGGSYTAQARDVGFPNMYEDASAPAGTYMPDGTLPNAQIDACWVGDAIAFRPR